MRIVCWQMIHEMSYLSFFWKLEKMSQNLSSTAVVIGTFKGQVWYLIVSIPDLCTITYFNS